MKRLIVSCDGTWNDPAQEHNGIPAPTNVVKLHHAIAPRDATGATQETYYHPGVGSEGSTLERFQGGAFGKGVTQQIQSAYHWLGERYDEGDEIFIFGFSRGAFIARCLGGFLGRGLLNLRGVSPATTWEQVALAYDKGYRVKGKALKDLPSPGWSLFHQGEPTPIRFLGVWDTVGALGIPDDLELLNLFEKPSKWRFHDTELGRHVESARHAMAIDEMRSSFTVTRWTNVDPARDVQERWFPGVHSDVGGGYPETALSDGALLWMMRESAKAGLGLREGVEVTLAPQAGGLMHNSFRGAFAKLRNRPRAVAALVAKNADQFDESAFFRQRVSPIAFPPYLPTTILEVGGHETVDVFARERWNATGIFLEAGQELVFSAVGEWLDGKDACDWNGTEDEKRSAGDLVRGALAFVGRGEELIKRATRNDSTDFFGTKRVEALRWFVMVGAIANDSGVLTVGNDGSPSPHQYIDLTRHQTGTPLRITRAGYLYCFANDAWSFYENNRGCVRLTVRRTA